MRAWLKLITGLDFVHDDKEQRTISVFCVCTFLAEKKQKIPINIVPSPIQGLICIGQGQNFVYMYQSRSEFFEEHWTSFLEVTFLALAITVIDLSGRQT